MSGNSSPCSKAPGVAGGQAATLSYEQPTEGMYFPNLFPPGSFPQKGQNSGTPHGRPRWSTTWSRTRIQVSFWEREKQSLGRGLESKACKSLSRHRFKEL